MRAFPVLSRSVAPQIGPLWTAAARRCRVSFNQPLPAVRMWVSDPDATTFQTCCNRAVPSGPQPL